METHSSTCLLVRVPTIDRESRIKLEDTRFRKNSTKNLLSRRKLHLVLDIDHTLLHTIFSSDLNPNRIEYVVSNLNDTLGYFTSEGETHFIKLRPFVRTFLKQASALFDMSLYTKGTKLYAQGIARVLDPSGIYFRNKIVGREDIPDNDWKTLDLVGLEKRAVLIVDDMEIWPDDLENLILIEKYNYFETDEYFVEGGRGDESEGGLAVVLRVLREVHRRFFEDDDVDIDCRDVRSVLKSIFNQL